MKRAIRVYLALPVLAAAVAALHAQSSQTARPVPTFTKDVAPILYKNCTSCHRPGEIAPMSLLTYEDARPYAKSIRDEVSEGHMPPWHAASPPGTFRNERHLSDSERETLVAWATNGAPKGDPRDLPPMPVYTDGWSIGKPDVVFEMAEDYKVPADGVVQYEYFYIPTSFAEPKLIRAIEVRPGNREVVHHVLVYYRAAPDMKRSPVFQPNPETGRTPEDRAAGVQKYPQRKDPPPPRLIASYAPGTNAQVAPDGTAYRLEPGGIIELQMHYTANGEPATDRTKVGMVFATGSGLREIRAAAFFNGTFTLPAGAPDVAVDADITFAQDATIWGLLPHTHLRGKKWRYVLELPDGTKRTILDVPKYDFNWQTYYMFATPLQVPKGARLVSTAWYDNSSANKANPDPKSDVKWGDQTWEEMQYTGMLFSPVRPPTPATAEPKRGG